MKEGEAEFLRQARLARRYGAAVIVMAFDEKGQADTYARKTEICRAPTSCSPASASRRRHHLRPEHLRHRHRHRGAQQLRRRLHRGGRLDSRQPAARADVGRRVERERSRSAATTRCARRSTRCSCTTRSRPACRWASSMPAARRLRRPRPGAAREGRGRGAQPPPGRRRSAGRVRADGEGSRRRRQAQGSRLARVAGRAAPEHALVKGITEFVVEDTEECRARSKPKASRRCR
jgi:hypothetical protein